MGRIPHPLWRPILVGRYYPTVESVWKSALRNPTNCPLLCDEEELLFAVQRGRQAVKEMIGVIQLKKYLGMRQRYETSLPAYSVEEATIDRASCKTSDSDGAVISS